MGRRVIILGAGESGTGAAILAKVKGLHPFVSDRAPITPHYRTLLDHYDIEWEEGNHSESVILSADEIIKSPGIPEHIPLLQKAREQGIPIISEIEFAGRYTDAKMICITGSNGKTTTAMLTHHLLKQAGVDVGLAGNVGYSLARQVAETTHDHYVVELSSFQLENMYRFKADIAILLNITPDHMDRYDHQIEQYVEAKFRILQNQTAADAFIYWQDDPCIQREIEKREPIATLYPFADREDSRLSGYIEQDQLILNTSNGMFTMNQKELALKGRHNRYNSMAAGISAKLLDIRNEKIRASLSDFTGVEHRLEMVTRIKGVDYINDSKATNVNSCWYALNSVNTRIVLILGGVDKGNNYTEIEPLLLKKARALIFLGTDNTSLHTFFDGKVPQIEEARSMQEAVNKAYQLAEKGDTVLLSPCCASFDLFDNYEDRGEQFKSCVRNL